MKFLVTDADGVNIASPVHCIDVNKTPPTPTGSNGINLTFDVIVLAYNTSTCNAVIAATNQIVHMLCLDNYIYFPKHDL